MSQDADSLPGSFRARVFSEDRNASSRGLGEAGQNSQQGGFAGAIAAEQCQARAAVHRETDVAERGIVAEEFPDALDRDGTHKWHRHPSLCRFFGLALDQVICGTGILACVGFSGWRWTKSYVAQASLPV